MAVGDFTQDALVRSSGTDPWALAQLVLAGRPDRVRTSGVDLHRRSVEAGEVARLGQVADASAAAGFTNDEVSVYDVAQARQRSRQALGGDGELLARASTTWTAMADDLDAAITAAGRHLDELTVGINRVIAARNDFMGSTAMLPEEAQAADRGFVAEADALVTAAAARIRTAVDGYDQQLGGHSVRLAALAGELVPMPATHTNFSLTAQMGGPVDPPDDGKSDGLLGDLGKAVDGLAAGVVGAVGGAVAGVEGLGDSVDNAVSSGINDLGNAVGGPAGDALIGAAGGLDDLGEGLDDLAAGAYGALGDVVGGETGAAYRDLGTDIGENGYDPEFDFEGTEFSRDEIEQFINGHTGDQNPAFPRPTESQVEQTLEHGTRTVQEDGTIQYDHVVNRREVRIYVNPHSPVDSTAFYLRED